MKRIGPIVIIEDDKDDQDILIDVLSALDIKYETRIFSLCETALEYMRTTLEKPFIILCDINLPMMNGLEFRRTINQDEFLRKKSIPFIFLSTTANAKQVHDAYDLTVQGFFVKNSTLDGMKEDIALIIEFWHKCVHPNTVRDRISR